MTVTKFGHSCLLVEEAGVRVLIDPGVYSTVPADLVHLNLILLTHEHPDHTDPATLKRLLPPNPGVTIYTNSGVGAVLEKEQIVFQRFEQGQTMELRGVSVEAIGTTHESILTSVPPVANTGFLIADRLFAPGDAFIKPERPIEILALPIAAPWSKISETLEYALAVKPSLVIPIHDGFLTPSNPFLTWISRSLPEHGIQINVLEIGVETEV